MGLALMLNLLPKRVCRRGHHPALTWRRCAFCDTKQHARWYEQRKEQVREYNKKYSAQTRIREYRRKKTAEYREQESVRLAHNTRERQRRKDKRYAFVRLVRSYGLEVIDFAYMLRGQDFRCATCREVLEIGKETHIDHCHTTERVRGILCGHCNVALGQARDNPATLRALADYIERNWWKNAEAVYENGKLVPWEPKS